MDNAVDRGAERHGRGDDLVARPEACHKHGNMQTGGTRNDCHGLLGARVLGKLLFKLGNFRARSEPAGTKRIHDFVDLRLLNEWSAKD